MPLIEVKDLTVNINAETVLKKLTLIIHENEHWAITGASGSGKTTLLKTLAGHHFHSGTLKIKNGVKLVLVPQQHFFKTLSNTTGFYYQQRFNSADAEDSMTAEAYLMPSVQNFKNSWASDIVHSILHLLHIESLLDKPLIQLSNGENKRLQLAAALLQQPNVLLLDNPYTGIDAEGRKVLTELLQRITRSGIQIIVALSGQVPPFVTHVLQLEKGGAAVLTHNSKQAIHHSHNHQLDVALLQQLVLEEKNDPFEYAVVMKNVQVAYGEKQILKGVNWQVKKGERWVLSGPNGAGKSTLLSLINADNPQAYANEIYLFDKRRGRGESIWDIKRRTGYISPELHLYFEKGISVFDVVASGLFDTIGLFRQLSSSNIKRIEDWLNLMQLTDIKRRFLHQLSNSQQRLVLLTRALIKNPPLLILDEPAQGLDEDQLFFFNSIIEHICQYTRTTIIYVSHYLEEIPSCINRYIRLENGSVVAIE